MIEGFSNLDGNHRQLKPFRIEEFRLGVIVSFDIPGTVREDSRIPRTNSYLVGVEGDFVVVVE